MWWPKQLFSKKKTREEVKDWLEEQEKQTRSNHEQLLENLDTKFPEVIESVSKALSSLQDAELRNPSIVDRARHLMEGNRRQFITDTNRLIEDLSVPSDTDDVADLRSRFQSYLSKSARSATITSEFFGNEINEVRKALSAIEELVVSLENSLADLDRIIKTKEQFNRISETEKQIFELEQKKAEIEERKQELKRKKPLIAKKQDDLHAGKEYLSMQEEVNDIVKQRQEAGQKISGFFQPLRGVFKKYAHANKQEKLTQYADDPVNALSQDYSLRVLHYVAPIKRAIEEGELVVYNKQQTLAALDKLNKKDLGQAMTDYARAKKEEAEIQSSMTKRAVMRRLLEFREQSKQIDEEIEQLEKTEIVFPDVQQEKEKLDKMLHHYKIKIA